MQESIQQLIKQANKSPVLEYNDNPMIFRDNIDKAIKKVKQRLGALQTLKAEIDYELTITHTDDEEFI